MSKAYKCDICGDLFTNQITISINDDDKAYLKMCEHFYDICPSCVGAIQKTVDERKHNSDNNSISCYTFKFGSINTADYMRCHKCNDYPKNKKGE